MKKSLKVLFLGNADNVNLKLCMWSRDIGIDASLWRMDEGGRGNPLEYAPDVFEQGNPEWVVGGKKSIKKLILSTFIKDKDIDFINKNYDVVIVSGKQALIFSYHINIPKILVPVGYEVCYFLDKKPILKMIKNILIKPKIIFDYYLNYFSFLAFKSITGIFDSFLHNFKIYEHFKSIEKLHPKSIGDDCEKVRQLVDNKILQRLEEETKSAKKVFLWFSRLNYKDISCPNYKGVDLFLEALGSIAPLLKNKEVVLYMGSHGIDKKDFIELAKKSPVYKYIRWKEHLEYPELLSYLSLKNAVLFTDFGENNAGVSGIGRDALTLGTVTINSCKDEVTALQYRSAAPKNYAATVQEIADQMKKMLEMSDMQFQNLQLMNIKYADAHLGHKEYMKWFYEDVEKINHAHRKTQSYNDYSMKNKKPI